MNESQLKAAMLIINALVTYGIPAGKAAYRAIRAIWGPELTEEECAVKLAWILQDASMRSLLAHGDATGGS